MPYNIVVLSEEAILYNPAFETIFVISFIIAIFSLILAFVFLKLNSITEYFFVDMIFDIMSNICWISLVVSFLSAIIMLAFQYEDTGRKKYSVVAQTEEQIEYIYDNYDITGSDGDIYYIEERTEQ